MIYKTSVIVSLFFLTACAQPKPYNYWDIEGLSSKEIKKELADCSYQVAKIKLPTQERENYIFNQCMVSKGGELKKGYR